MEYYCDSSLDDILAYGRIEDEASIQSTSRDLLTGIEYLHSQGIIQ